MMARHHQSHTYILKRCMVKCLRQHVLPSPDCRLQDKKTQIVLFTDIYQPCWKLEDLYNLSFRQYSMAKSCAPQFHLQWEVIESLESEAELYIEQ